MATKASTIEYIEDQLSDVQNIRSRKMFGEYALYCEEKVVALICDDTLFVKKTDEGESFVGDRYEEDIPYPGAKPAMRIDEDLIEDREWLAELIRLTEAALPASKSKGKKKNLRKEKPPAE